MKKAIALSVVFGLLICLQASSQCGSHKCCTSKKIKSSEKSVVGKESNWKPFVEATYQFGLCGNGNPVGVIAGAQKQMTKHFSVSGDVQFWKTNYENWGIDLHSVGNYTTVIPSIKFKFDPGRQNRGFFVGAGIGYAVVRDRGTEQRYTVDPSSGTKTNNGTVTPGNWDFKTFSPSLQWGFGFKVFKLPVSFVNTSYFGNTTEGWGGIAVGTGLRVGLNKIKEQRRSCGEKKTSHSNFGRPGGCQKRN